MTAIKPLENFDDVTLRLAHYICQLTLICHNNSANKISDIAGGIGQATGIRGIGRVEKRVMLLARVRGKRREAKKKGAAGNVLLNRLLPKKLRSGKEQERLRGAGTGGWERKTKREKERATINVDVFLRPLGRRNVCSGKCNHAVI